VLIERVHAACAYQAHDVQRAVVPTCVFDQLHESGNTEELANVNRLRYAHDILRHDSTRAEIQMPHFTIADLSVGKANREAGRLQQCARCALPQRVPHGSLPELDRVALAARAEAPTVEHDEDHRGARATAHCHIEGDAS